MVKSMCQVYTTVLATKWLSSHSPSFQSSFLSTSSTPLFPFPPVTLIWKKTQNSAFVYLGTASKSYAVRLSCWMKLPSQSSPFLTLQPWGQLQVFLFSTSKKHPPRPSLLTHVPILAGVTLKLLINIYSSSLLSPCHQRGTSPDVTSHPPLDRGAWPRIGPWERPNTCEHALSHWHSLILLFTEAC